MAQTLDCPNCHAHLELPPDNRDATIRCAYCQSTVIVPESLRAGSGARSDGSQQGAALQDALILLRNGRKVEAIKRVREGFGVGLTEAKTMVEALEQSEAFHNDAAPVDISIGTLTAASAAPAAKTGGCGGCVATIAALVVLVTGGMIAFLTLGGPTELGLGQDSPLLVTLEAVVSEATGEEGLLPQPTTTPALSMELLIIGGQEGTGPGFFNDTRHVGVDGSGTIYTLDYSGGRVQLFDAAGTFVDTYTLPGDPAVLSMAISREGTLYAVTSGVVERYEARNGTPLGPLGPAGVRFDVVAVGPDSAVYIFNNERLMRFDRSGAVTLDVTGFLPTERSRGFFYDALAVDGSGNIFILEEKSVLRFDANGRFVDRFGSAGDGPDQFQIDPYAIAIDGQDRVVLSGLGQLLVFDTSGRFLETIPHQGATFSMLFTDANELLVMDRNGNRVVKLEILGAR